MTFTTEKMQTIFPLLKKLLQTQKSISFFVLNPDVENNVYAGSILSIKNTTYLYRGYKTWTDLAELLKCKMLTPKKSSPPLVKLTFETLNSEHNFHNEIKNKEKYGTDSYFTNIYKMEEPAFFYYYEQSLDNVNIEKRNKILNLGINRGDEFEVIKNKLDINKYNNKVFIGIDHSKSAINLAKKKFPEKNVHFYTTDINDLDSLELGEFDLLISIGTLQSPSIHFKPFLMSLVQKHLKKDSALILGFPNSRWLGGEILYGAKAPNYTMNEMSILFNDVIFAKKYLQQKKYRVTLTGKYYIFLTATKIC